jgi:selenide,water dikinase
VEFADRVSAEARDLLFDPQTSGGLLISIDPGTKDRLLSELAEQGEPAWEIGRVTDAPGPGVVVR